MNSNEKNLKILKTFQNNFYMDFKIITTMIILLTKYLLKHNIPLRMKLLILKIKFNLSTIFHYNILFLKICFQNRLIQNKFSFLRFIEFVINIKIVRGLTYHQDII